MQKCFTFALCAAALFGQDFKLDKIGGFATGVLDRGAAEIAAYDPRTLIDSAFDGAIRVRRYLCQACRRAVSLLPEFALPYLRSSVAVIALFLVARLLHAKTLAAAKLRNSKENIMRT